MPAARLPVALPPPIRVESGGAVTALEPRRSSSPRQPSSATPAALSSSALPGRLPPCGASSAPVSPMVLMDQPPPPVQRLASHRSMEQQDVLTGARQHAWPPALPQASVSFAAHVHGSPNKNAALPPVRPVSSPRGASQLPWLNKSEREAPPVQLPVGGSRSLPPSPPRVVSAKASSDGSADKDDKDKLPPRPTSATRLFCKVAPASAAAQEIPLPLPHDSSAQQPLSAPTFVPVRAPSPSHAREQMSAVPVGELRRNQVFDPLAPVTQPLKTLSLAPVSMAPRPVTPSSQSSSCLSSHSSFAAFGSLASPTGCGSTSSSTIGGHLSPVSCASHSLESPLALATGNSHFLSASSVSLAGLAVSLSMSTDLPRGALQRYPSSNVRLQYDPSLDRFVAIADEQLNSAAGDDVAPLSNSASASALAAPLELLPAPLCASAASVSSSSSSLFSAMGASSAASNSLNSSSSSSASSSASSSVLTASSSSLLSSGDLSITTPLSAATSSPMGARAFNEQHALAESEMELLPPISPVPDLCHCPMNRPRNLTQSGSSSSGDEEGQSAGGSGARLRRSRRRGTGSMIDLQGLGSFIAAQLKYRPGLKLHMSSPTAPAPVLVASALPFHLQSRIKRERQAARAANLLRGEGGASAAGGATRSASPTLSNRGSLQELGRSHHRQIAQKQQRLAVSPAHGRVAHTASSAAAVAPVEQASQSTDALSPTSSSSSSAPPLRVFDMSQLRPSGGSGGGTLRASASNPALRSSPAAAAAASYVVETEESSAADQSGVSHS